MNLTLDDSEKFLDSFIQPISRITDGGILKIEPDKISSLIATGDGTIIVYGEYAQSFPVTEPLVLNIPDLKKLHKLLSLIGTDINLVVDTNSVAYSSDTVRFKYHLYENGIIKTPSLNMAKLKTINFDGSFTITSERLRNLLKGSTLNPDISKVYITFNGGKVFAELTDKARHNVDSYATIIAEDYTNAAYATSIPINFEIIRLLSASKIAQFNVKLATKLNVFNFELISEKVSLNYIVSALTN